MRRAILYVGEVPKGRFYVDDVVAVVTGIKKVTRQETVNVDNVYFIDAGYIEHGFRVATNTKLNGIIPSVYGILLGTRNEATLDEGMESFASHVARFKDLPESCFRIIVATTEDLADRCKEILESKNYQITEVHQASEVEQEENQA